jgi:hypothetical protein
MATNGPAYLRWERASNGEPSRGAFSSLSATRFETLDEAIQASRTTPFKDARPWIRVGQQVIRATQLEATHANRT